ncbi:MAG: ABC transporter permease [Christensenellales bacterium]
MFRHVLKKTLIAIATIWIIITISFILVHTMPGDPIIFLIGEEEYYYLLDNNPAYLEQLINKYGLNDSLDVKYIRYMESVIKLDFGESYYNHRPVIENFKMAAKWTLMLSIPTLLISSILGAVLGVYAGIHPGGRFDRIATPFFLALKTIPSNCLSLLLLILFAYKLRWVPINGMVSPGVEGMKRVMSILRHMILPVSILVAFRTSGSFMLMKSTVSQIRNEEYVLTARSKGIGKRKVLFRHVLKNAMVPYSTSLCMQLGGLLSGAMNVEVVFGWRGMGQMMYNAVSRRDFATAQFCFLLSAVCVVLSNLLGDIVNAAIDPRIREEVPLSE